METVLKAIADWIKGILTAGIMSNLSGLFDAVNEQVGDIAQQVGTRPSAFEPRVFAMIESLSRNVVLPIAGVILTFIACYELIEMITQHNNMAQFEPALIMRWIFKTAVSVWFISNTFDIVMAVFDLTQKVVSDSSGIIAGNTRVNEIGLSMLEASLMQMDVGPLFGLFLQSFFIGITMRILSIVIFVIVYGRMIEIYCMVSLAPIPMATWGNHMLEELAEELERFLGIVPEDVDDAVPRTRRTVNREKVTDHHAILPTHSMLQADLDALPKGEQNILKLIIARTLMAVSKPFRYLETLLTTECAGEEFTAKGKEILDEGWKAIERKVLADILNRKKEFAALPPVEESECGILNAELKEGQTSPPKHFTEDTLLHSMETASADSMPEDAERQGIGTPATRAATIEKLVAKGFLERKGDKKTKFLLPTDKGKALITVMPEEIQSADMTADWETKLLRVEHGEMEPETFMTEIKDMISSLVNTTEAVKGASALMKNKVIGVCPNCGANVVEREKGWFCESNPCRFVLWKDNSFFKRLGKRMDAHVADKLLRDGRVRLKDCKSAKGKTYNATVLLATEADGRSKFSLEFEGGR